VVAADDVVAALPPQAASSVVPAKPNPIVALSRKTARRERQ